MHSSKDSPPGRIIGDKLTEKCSPIPEAPLTSQLSIETEPTVHNKASDLSLAHTDGQGQTAEEIAYSQRFALRSLPGMVPFKAQFDDHSLIASLYSLDSLGRRTRGGRR